jgi:hypothetical protein
MVACLRAGEAFFAGIQGMKIRPQIGLPLIN